MADSRQLPRVTGMTSSVGAALENFHVRKQEKNSGSTCARKKKKPKKHHEKTIRATPKTGDFFSFGDGGQYPPVGVILRIIRATPKLVISSFDNGGLYPHVGIILRS